MRTNLALTLIALGLNYGHVAHADTFGFGADTFDIEFVPIGDPNNSDDAKGVPNPAGKVEYSYRIGKFEISRRFITKANAEGGLGITLDPSELVGGTIRLDMPATGVSWFEAARFINWLNTSSGHFPAYKFDVDGNFQLWQAGDLGYDPMNLYRNRHAFYFLPSSDEWYKAAYYDAELGEYYYFPTGSNSQPDGIDFEGDTMFDAVYDEHGFRFAPRDITDVGTLSPYGTAGQGGNAFEWEETEVDLTNDTTLSQRAFRGGGMHTGYTSMRSSVRFGNYPAFESDAGIGFRVASKAIPEHSTLVLLLASCTLSAIRPRNTYPTRYATSR